MLLADRGYDADWIRELARQQGAWANIPPKRDRKDPICFSPYLYRARNLIERFFNKIKQCRRVATRYDKLAANYLAFVKLASIRIWLRANEFALTTSPLHKSSCSTHPDKGWLAVPSCIAKQGINEGGCSLLKLLAAVADLASRLNVRFAPEAASRKSSKNDVCFSLRSGHPCQISHVSNVPIGDIERADHGPTFDRKALMWGITRSLRTAHQNDAHSGKVEHLALGSSETHSFTLAKRGSSFPAKRRHGIVMDGRTLALDARSWVNALNALRSLARRHVRGGAYFFLPGLALRDIAAPA